MLSPTGDYVFGQGPLSILVDSPEAVAQAVKTRLALWANEWFLDLTEGTEYMTKVLGTGTQGVYDQTIQERILGTEGVVSIQSYASSVDSNRNLSISATVVTLYGTVTIDQAF